VMNILSIHYKCSPSAIIQKLNISDHMLIWTLILDLVCVPGAQNLSAPFSCDFHSINIDMFREKSLRQKLQMYDDFAQTFIVYSGPRIR
jgi:hypothetical protein